MWCGDICSVRQTVRKVAARWDEGAIYTRETIVKVMGHGLHSGKLSKK